MSELEAGQGKMLTVQEAAAHTGLAETTIRDAINQGRIPFVRQYGRKLVAQSEIDGYVARTHPDGVIRRGRPRRAEVAGE